MCRTICNNPTNSSFLLLVALAEELQVDMASLVSDGRQFY